LIAITGVFNPGEIGWTEKSGLSLLKNKKSAAKFGLNGRDT
jgi:hypothetical protein